MPHFSAKHYSIKSQKDADRAKSYADSINPETLLHTDTITNCITEIPQDIKLELNNGTLTLKAGSKVYVPNGSGVFDEVTVSGDVSQIAEQLSGTGKWLLCVKQNGNGVFPRTLANCVSGAGVTTIAGWAYDTTTNLINWYSASGEKQSGNFSLPVCIFSTTNGVPTSIDQVFNGFGYIGSTVFALPNVKGLIPNGRNEDGSLNNIEFTTNRVTINTQNWMELPYILAIANPTGIPVITFIQARDYWISDAQPSSPDASWGYWYSPRDNFIRRDEDSTKWKQYPATIIGTMSINSNRSIAGIKPKLLFRAVDQNDFNRLDEEVTTLDAQNVKLTGSQLIAGQKLFTSIPVIRGVSESRLVSAITGYQHGTAPSTVSYGGVRTIDSTNKEVGSFGTRIGTDGANKSFMAITSPANVQSVDQIAIQGQSDGTFITYAPTPPASDNSTQIATTSWVNNKHKVVSALPSSPDANTFYYIPE